MKFVPYDLGEQLDGGDYLCLRNSVPNQHFRQSGTLTEWQEHVAGKCPGNPIIQILVMRSVVDGLEKHIDMYESEILDVFKNAIGMICIYRDVTRQLQIERRLKLRANTDDLTELFNRHYFFKNIPATLSAGAGLAYIDLDNFKHGDSPWALCPV